MVQYILYMPTHNFIVDWNCFYVVLDYTHIILLSLCIIVVGYKVNAIVFLYYSLGCLVTVLLVVAGWCQTVAVILAHQVNLPSRLNAEFFVLPHTLYTWFSIYVWNTWKIELPALLLNVLHSPSNVLLVWQCRKTWTHYDSVLFCSPPISVTAACTSLCHQAPWQRYNW